MTLEGQQIDHYRLVRLLGSGSMGEVYLAEDAAIQRQVAIKVIRAEAAFSFDNTSIQEMARLFQREVKVIAMLDHPHILPLYDYGETTINDMTVAYLVMPYRSEGSLVSWFQQRKIDTHAQQLVLQPQDVIPIMQQAADALQYAHNHQVIHQDVKPANFLVRSNQEHVYRPDVLLADFGIAKFTTATTATASQTIRGTPAYMAPEQINGHPVPATDQYALAIMAYELLTGHPPFQGGIAQILYQQLNSDPALPSTQNPSLSGEVDAVLLKALAKQPANRFTSITAFAKALQEALQNVNTAATQIERAEPTPSLRATLTISDAEAIYGTSRDVLLPDGRYIHLNVPAGARSGQFVQLQIPTLYGSGIEQALITLTVTPSIVPPTNPYVNETTLAAPLPSPPTAPPPPASSATTQRSRGYIILSIVLLFLVLAGGTLFVFSHLPLNTAPLTIHSTTTTQYTATSTANASTTSTATNSTPTSTPVLTPTTTQGTDPYTHTGTLVLTDSLQSNGQNTDWMTGTNQNDATCTFTQEGYQSSQPVDGDFHACTALATNFSNFVYEVQMVIVSGDSGGITFRANQDNSTFYYFRVGQDGSYDVRVYVDSQIGDSKQLASGSSTAIRSGTNQTNIVAVVAQGSSFQFYINHQLVSSANDSTFTQGQIGVVAYNQGALATSTYSNLRVWAL